MHFDVFNGDADGILSLLQLRLAYPKESTLITGVKRNINLVKEVSVNAGDTLTILDISMEKNQTALKQCLKKAEHIEYFDHHRSGEVPSDANLSAFIDLDPDMCTALIVDRYLDGRYREWAIAAAYGDNLTSAANGLAKQHGLTESQSEQLQELGILVNYNGYGVSIDDLHYHPAALYQKLSEYTSPFDLIDDRTSPFYVLQEAYEQDMTFAQNHKPLYESEHVCVIVLADQPAARRVSGVFGNLVANQTPDKAHAILTLNADKTYTVSLRAPLNNKQGAGDICAQFPSGGGRAAAAGINALEETQIETFIERLEAVYG